MYNVTPAAHMSTTDYKDLMELSEGTFLAVKSKSAINDFWSKEFMSPGKRRSPHCLVAIEAEFLKQG